MTIKMNWRVCWTYNGVDYSEAFEFRLMAEIKMIQLESWGQKPSLHQI